MQQSRFDLFVRKVSQQEKDHERAIQRKAREIRNLINSRDKRIQKIEDDPGDGFIQTASAEKEKTISSIKAKFDQQIKLEYAKLKKLKRDEIDIRRAAGRQKDIFN